MFQLLGETENKITEGTISWKNTFLCHIGLDPLSHSDTHTSTYKKDMHIITS